MKRFNRFPVLLALLVALAALAACAPQPGVTPVAFRASESFSEVEFIGTLESTAPSEWVVSGQVVKLNAQTQVQNTPAIGEMVQVRAQVSASGEVTALRIETQTRQQPQDLAQAQNQSKSQVQSQSAFGQSFLEFYGVVESIAPNIWVVSGRTFSIANTTEIKGNIRVGANAKVEYLTNADGSFTARQITLAEALQAGNTFTLQIQNQIRQEFELFGVVDAIAATEWVVAGQTFIVTPQTQIKNTIVVGDFVKVHLYTENDMLTAHEIELANRDDRGAYLEFTGVVQSLSATELVVDGQTFRLTPDTRLKGIIALGDTVKVEVVTDADGTLIAREVSKVDNQGGSLSSGGSSSSGRSSSRTSSSSSSTSSEGSSSSAGSSSSDDDDDGYDDDEDDEDDDDEDHGSSSSSSSKSHDD